MSQENFSQESLENLTEEEKKIISEAIEKLRDPWAHMPPKVKEFVARVSELAQDEAFIENLRKEILNRYGE